MSYPYVWQNDNNTGIKGPTPKTQEVKSEGGLETTSIFYTGFEDNDYKTLIRSSIQRILLTKPGERVMLPDFGCDLDKYIFEPNDSLLELQVRNEITNAITKWEPRITLKNITVTVNNNALLISIPYIINGKGVEDMVNYVVREKS